MNITLSDCTSYFIWLSVDWDKNVCPDFFLCTATVVTFPSILYCNDSFYRIFVFWLVYCCCYCCKFKAFLSVHQRTFPKRTVPPCRCMVGLCVCEGDISVRVLLVCSKIGREEHHLGFLLVLFTFRVQVKGGAWCTAVMFCATLSSHVCMFGSYS